jgi:hypothetical protein
VFLVPSASSAFSGVYSSVLKPNLFSPTPKFFLFSSHNMSIFIPHMPFPLFLPNLHSCALFNFNFPLFHLSTFFFRILLFFLCSHFLFSPQMVTNDIPLPQQGPFSTPVESRFWDLPYTYFFYRFLDPDPCLCIADPDSDSSLVK